VHEGGYGITITDDETGRCQWRGEDMDYSQAIEAMQFLEHRASAGAVVT
jgi:hypothetical protein